MQDRRSGTERRTSERHAVSIPIEWETGTVRHQGSISDLSLNGCFVLSSGDVMDGDSVRIFIPLAEGMKVQFAGRIANHVLEIGFGVKFDDLTPGQEDMIRSMLNEIPAG